MNAVEGKQTREDVTSAGVTFTVFQETFVIFSNALNLETGNPGYTLK